MAQILNYHIHDLKFQIVTNKLHAMTKSLNFPFSFFEIEDQVDEPDVILNVGKFKPSNNDCYIIDHKYCIKENYFYCRESVGMGGWETEIFGFEKGRTTINFSGNFIGPELLLLNLIAQEVALMPIIIYKLSKKGYYPIHAGGVSKDNDAYVFAGRGGSSKSELIADFVKFGLYYLGDDWVIIHKDKVFPFPKSFYLFNFSLKTGSFPTENFSTIISKIRYLNYLRINPNQNLLSVSEPCMLKTLFFITKTNVKKISKKTVTLEDAISKLIANNEMEMITNPSIMGRYLGRYYNYMLAYSFVFPNSNIAKYWDDIAKKLKEILTCVPIYEIDLPEEYTTNTFKDVLNNLRGV